jgi:hypothetical protein
MGLCLLVNERTGGRRALLDVVGEVVDFSIHFGYCLSVISGGVIEFLEEKTGILFPLRRAGVRNKLYAKTDCKTLGGVLLFLFGALFDSGYAGVWQGVNQAAGVAIFSDDLLWDDSPMLAGTRMGLIKESETPIDSVYRSYAGGRVLSFGGRLKSLQLSESGGAVTGVSMVFSNQGDGGGGDSSVESAIREDKREVESALQKLFGRGEPYSFGRGARREPGMRWDWQGHSFLLIYKPENYVALRIVPTESLQGYGKRVLDKNLREEVAKRVVRRANGDVVISGLPMVDQGDKGYCVPAVWEMALRSMGVEADMYLLAAEMGSRGMAGTELGRALEVGREVAEDGGRTMVVLRGPPTVLDISRWIDRGVPVIWPMRCSPQFLSEGLERSAKRRGMADPAEWKRGENASRIKSPRDDEWFGHVCLITGYNKETGELAITDSWGMDHRERWHTEKQVKEVSSGELFAVEF